MNPLDLRDALKVRWLKQFLFTLPIGYTLYPSLDILWLFWFFSALGFCSVIAVVIAQYHVK